MAKILVTGSLGTLGRPLVRGLKATVGAHGVAVGAEDQLDRIDERAVEVEQEGGERHAGS